MMLLQIGLLAFAISYVIGIGNFAPGGRLPAMEAATQMSCIDEFCVCMNCKDGLVAVAHAIEMTEVKQPQQQKRKATRLLATRRRRIFKLKSANSTDDRNIIVVMTGVPSDCQYMLNYLRISYEEYHRIYATPPPLVFLAEEASTLLHSHSTARQLRPLSVQLILAQAHRPSENLPLERCIIHIDSQGGYTQNMVAVITPSMGRVINVKPNGLSNVLDDEEEECARKVLEELRAIKWNELPCEEAVDQIICIAKEVYGIVTPVDEFEHTLLR